MAYIRKLRDKWQVVIRRKNYPNISKVFIQKSLANKWAKETELAMEKEQFEDLSTASSTLLKSLLQRYRDEITSKKKSARSETYRLNWLIRHKISDVSLTRLKSKDLYDLRSELTELDKAPATIKHYLTLLANVWNVAQRQWGINLPVNSPFKFFKFGKINNLESIKGEFKFFYDKKIRKWYLITQEECEKEKIEKAKQAAMTGESCEMCEG